MRLCAFTTYAYDIVSIDFRRFEPISQLLQPLYFTALTL